MVYSKTRNQICQGTEFFAYLYRSLTNCTYTVQRCCLSMTYYLHHTVDIRLVWFIY